MEPRPTFDVLYLRIADELAMRGTCSRLQVGAVITKETRIVGTGYNGACSSEPHCVDVGCELENDHCVRSVHAEVNAIINAARLGNSTEGGTLYLTHASCFACAKLVLNSGIRRVLYQREYRKDNRVRDLFDRADVKYMRVYAQTRLPEAV